MLDYHNFKSVYLLPAFFLAAGSLTTFPFFAGLALGAFLAFCLGAAFALGAGFALGVGVGASAASEASAFSVFSTLAF